MLAWKCLSFQMHLLFYQSQIQIMRSTTRHFTNSRSKYFLIIICKKYFRQDCTLPVSTLGRVAQSVMCLATDASLTADPEVASSIPARSHTFLEIDHEIMSTVILLPSAESFKKGCCQLQVKVCALSTG